MITNINIKNFKALRDCRFKTKNLNLLTGLNSSGKSTLIQAMLLLRQSPEIEKGKVMLSNAPYPLVDIGVGNDIYSEFGVGDFISIELQLNNVFLSWNFEYNTQTKEHQNKDALESPEKYAPEVLQNCSIFKDVERISSKKHKNKEKIISYFQYLYSDRIAPQEKYTISSSAISRGDLGTRGEHVVYYLHLAKENDLDYRICHDCLSHPKAKGNFLLQQVEAWLNEISPNISFQTERISDEDVKLEFKVKHSSLSYKPKNVGFGLSYVLPVIVSVLLGQPGKLILIENPESHIHPRGQVELGRLLAKAAQAGMQLFVETHSDHILNGVRLACKEKDMNPDLFTAFFFKQNENENQSDITQIVFDEKGKLYKYEDGERKTQIPKGFFDEWAISMSKLF